MTATDGRYYSPAYLADLVDRRLGARTLSIAEVRRIVREEFPGYDLALGEPSQIRDLVERARLTRTDREVEVHRTIAAITEVARALKAAGKSREEADESLRLTTHVDYHGHVTDVMREVYPLEPVFDIRNAPWVVIQDVVDAIGAVAADFQARAASVRPTGVGHDEVSADIYDECARDLRRAFGLPTDEEG